MFKMIKTSQCCSFTVFAHALSSLAMTSSTISDILLHPRILCSRPSEPYCVIDIRKPRCGEAKSLA